MTAAVLTGFLLGGCTIPLHITVSPTCLPMVVYSAADQAKASAERKTLPDDDILNLMLTSYGQLRAENRAACPPTQGITK